MNASTDHVMTALQLDKVLEAGGVTIEDLRQDNASKESVSEAIKKILHSNGATPKGVIASLLLQKIMSSLNVPPDALAKLILLEKSLYDAGKFRQLFSPDYSSEISELKNLNFYSIVN